MRLRSLTAAALALIGVAAPAFSQSETALESFIDKSRPGLQLERISTFRTGVFDESAMEIAGYDEDSYRLFITNGAANRLWMIDLTDQANPQLLGEIDLSPYGDGVNSVAASDGLVAVAVEADPVTDPGRVVFFDIDGNLIGTAEAGALPDMVTFTPDGTRVITANEGEPDDGVDPPGGVTVIDVTDAANGNFTSTQLGFEAFDSRRAELVAKGVRLFPDAASVSQDLEPEYVAVTPDGSIAFVTLQEANAFAVVDLENLAILDVTPLGVKNHSHGPIQVDLANWFPRPVLGTTATVNPANPAETTPGQQILLGGLSGLWFDGVDPFTGRYRFLTVPDRGPNGEPTDVDGDGANERPFALPDYQAQIVHFEFDPATKSFFITEQLPLVRGDGVTPVTGLPNIPGVDEEPVDLFGNLLPYDARGADMEGVLRSQDGHYWLVDEYRPSIYHFDEDGVMIDRFVPEGTGALPGEPAGTFGAETLPAGYSNRRPNRGFEAVAFDPQTPTLYAFIQTPFANPDRAASDASDVIRILAFDPVAGQPVGEYVYLLEAPDHRDAKVDKMGDAVWTGGGRMHVIERDSSVGPTGKKYIFEIDLKGATNLLAPGTPALMDGKTLEQHTADELAAVGIRPVHKTKVGNLPSLGYRAGDKPEGLALLPGGRLAVLNDNDFDLFDGAIAGDGTVPVNPSPVPVQLAILSTSEGNQLDASDRDDTINIRNWPILGQFMPDAIDSFPALGRNWFITANEGDARSEDDRVADFVLDPDVFLNAAALQENENLGRYEASTIQGDLDGDGDYDRIYGYGARSATIWDEFGNLLWDSGDDVAWVTALSDPAFFNATNDENGFDSRSDAKGAEPEAVETGWFFGRRYAFLGLERVGGVMVYDIADPTEVFFVDYVNVRDFFGDAELDTADDLGPEGIFYIKRRIDEVRPPALVVTNEVSGSVSIYRPRHIPAD